MKNDLRPEHLSQEVTVALPLSVVLRITEDPQPAAVLQSSMQLPKIGEEFHGGKFSGVTLDGDQLAALVLLLGDFNGTFEEAKDWADKEDGVLPSRHDQLVLFKNMKGEFKEAYYWSGEQRAGAAGCAWSQGFGYGDQSWYAVSYRYRARAVRRIPIR